MPESRERGPRRRGRSSAGSCSGSARLPVDLPPLSQVSMSPPPAHSPRMSRTVALRCKVLVSRSPCLERLEPRAARVRLARERAHRARRRARAARRSQEREEQLCPHLGREARDRADERVVGPARQPPHTRRRLLSELGHELRLSSVGDEPTSCRDQPLARRSSDVLVGADDLDTLPGVDVDVVALEVQRPLVAVDGRPDLVRRRVRDPVVLRLERPGLLAQHLPDRRLAR